MMYYMYKNGEQEKLEAMIGKPVLVYGHSTARYDGAIMSSMRTHRGILMEVNSCSGYLESIVIMGDDGRIPVSFDISDKSDVWDIYRSVTDGAETIIKTRRKK